MCYGYHIWSKEPLMQAKNDGDLHGGQRSSEVKCSKVCAMATKLGQKNRWYKFRMMMMTFTEVKGQQMSNIKQWPTDSKFSQKNRWCKLEMMVTFMEVKGHQRSSVVKYVLWLPNLVRRTADTSLGWWWPSRRSKVNRCQILNNDLWIVNLVIRTADASLRWRWPSWRSKVIRGQMWKTMCYGYHIWLNEPSSSSSVTHFAVVRHSAA